MLLLTGPAGSGKSATIYALADEMNIDIKEWANPTAENTQRMNPDRYNGPGIKLVIDSVLRYYKTNC